MVSLIPPVTYLFETTAEVGEWTCLSFELEETLSNPYRTVIRVAQPSATGDDPEAFLGSDAVLVFARDDAIERRHCGLVSGIATQGILRDHLVVRLEVVPALFALSQRVTSRIFQDQDAKQILLAVLQPALADYQRSVNADGVGRTLPVREYTVQYRESDLDFVQRLMAQEGISYRFDHSGATEELVLFDANDACPGCETVDGGEIPIAEEQGAASTESFQRFYWHASMRPTSVVVRDFDWTQPAVDLTHEARATDPQERERELYASGSVTTIGDYQGNAFGSEDGQEQANLRQEAEKVQQEQGSGQGNVISLCPGVHFVCSQHAFADVEDAFLVTRIKHRGANPRGELGWQDPEDTPNYANSFECIPLAVPVRPPRRRPPARIVGPQTATVVGPTGEEVFTDEHGRIKVQFHWDRDAHHDEHSSCFLRVAQTWAHAGYGSLFIPRLGMEVVVHFLDGHPDRPVVNGCLYNGENPTPYPLPAEKTKSVLCTRSSLGGGGSNELSFEDASGAEQITMRAQKNWRSDVLNDMNTRVGANQNVAVDVNRKKQIAGDQTVTIDGNENNTIGGNQTLALTGNDEATVNGDRTTTLSGNDENNTGANQSTAIAGDDTLSTNGNRRVAIAGNLTHNVGGSYTVNVGSGHTLTVNVLGAIQIWGGANWGQIVNGMEDTVSLGPVKFKWDGVAVDFTGSAKLSIFAGGKFEDFLGVKINRSWSNDRTLALNDNTTDSDATHTVKGGCSETVLAGSSLWTNEDSEIKLDGAFITCKPKGVLNIDARTTFKDEVTLKGNLVARLEHLNASNAEVG